MSSVQRKRVNPSRPNEAAKRGEHLNEKERSTVPSWPDPLSSGSRRGADAKIYAAIPGARRICLPICASLLRGMRNLRLRRTSQRQSLFITQAAGEART